MSDEVTTPTPQRLFHANGPRLHVVAPSQELQKSNGELMHWLLERTLVGWHYDPKTRVFTSDHVPTEEFFAFECRAGFSVRELYRTPEAGGYRYRLTQQIVANKMRQEGLEVSPSQNERH